MMVSIRPFVPFSFGCCGWPVCFSLVFWCGRAFSGWLLCRITCMLFWLFWVFVLPVLHFGSSPSMNLRAQLVQAFLSLWSWWCDRYLCGFVGVLGA